MRVFSGVLVALALTISADRFSGAGHGAVVVAS